MRAIRRISAAIVGSVFFLAAIFKLIDSVGAGLVVEAYFKFLHLYFLMPAAKFIAIFMAFAECAIGAALITDVWHKITGIVSAVFILFFTLLTLAILIANPSMDCGCFGEVIHLSHAQTFIKNIVLCLLWAVAFVPLKIDYTVKKTKYAAFGLALVSSLILMIYSFRALPLMDFTPMAPGTELMPMDEYAPDAPKLTFADTQGVYADSLLFGNQVMLLSMYDPASVSQNALDKLESFIITAESSGFLPLVLVCADPSELGAISSREEILQRLYFADRKDLMTLNRSNGGLTYVSDGEIVAKWPLRSYPSSDVLNELIDTDSTEAMMDLSLKSRMRLQAFLLYVFAVMLLI